MLEGKLYGRVNLIDVSKELMELGSGTSEDHQDVVKDGFRKF